MPEPGPGSVSPTARGLDSRALDYSASISYDRRLYKQDIAGSIAHARMLGKQGIIAPDDSDTIVLALKRIEQEIEEARFPFRKELEDIHLNIESRLYQRIGDIAGRLHTARSRNDQVATDLRMFVKDACRDADTRLRKVQSVLVDLAEANIGTIMPGYTHLQRAQPVLLAHHLLAHGWSLAR
ncbi:MAG TPA: lyase family protein, partial [Dehalococcoidia bacterium]|nr:lyase family protein [Dehalococcoidia bacterium]